MKKYLRITIQIIAILMVFNLVGCGNSNNTANQTNTGVQSPSPAGPQSTANKVQDFTNEVKEKAPDYPLDKIPLYNPTKIKTVRQNNSDIPGSTAKSYGFYIEYNAYATPDELLDYYSQIGNKYTDFEKKDLKTTDGKKAYNITFKLPDKHLYKVQINISTFSMDAQSKENVQVSIGLGSI